MIVSILISLKNKEFYIVLLSMATESLYKKTKQNYKSLMNFTTELKGKEYSH